MPDPRRFLFLQGPISPFFPRLAELLQRRGHVVFRINVCLGDKLVWRAPAVDFKGRLEEWPAFIANFLARHAITDLVLLGEQRPYHRVAIAAARHAGVRVTATDFGYLRPDWIVLEEDGLNRESRFPRDPQAILELAKDLPPVPAERLYADSFFNQAVWDMAFHLANLSPWPFPHFRTFLLHHPVPAYLGTGLRLLMRRRERRRTDALMARIGKAAPYWLFAMQMETDYSIRAYSRYPDMDTPIGETITSFARHAPPEAHLLVKVHPLDPGLKAWRRRIGRMARQCGVAERVHYLGEGPLDELLSGAQGCVTVNSTAGVRALQLGCPILALGEALYRIPGLVHGGGLDDFWSAPQPPDRVLAEAFLRGIAWHLHVRGTYYAEPGLTAAVEAAAYRLENGLVGKPVLPDETGVSPRLSG